MSELQKIIKEEIEYALLEENVELEEGIGSKIAGALAGLAMMGGAAKAAPVPVKIVDMRGNVVAARVINAKDQTDALQKAQEVASEMGQFFAEPASEEEVKSFRSGAEGPAVKASPAVKSERGSVQKIDDKTFKVTGVKGDRDAAMDALIDFLKKPVPGKAGSSMTNLSVKSFTPDGSGGFNVSLK